MNEDTKHEGEQELGAHVFGSKDQVPRSGPDQDVHVWYRPTENCVSEEKAVYPHADIDLPEVYGRFSDFIKVMDAKTKRTLALFHRDCVVRVDFIPHEEPAHVVPTKGHPMQA